MLNTESAAATVAQAAVAVALILGAAMLAYVDPGVRAQLAGAFILGIGAASGFFFSQRSNTAGSTQTLNGMSHMASLIASGTPGPAGAMGARGPIGPGGSASVVVTTPKEDAPATVQGV